MSNVVVTSCARPASPEASCIRATGYWLSPIARTADVRRARLLLETINQRGELEPAYPYPVQVWKLGELTWVFLGGEVVVDYSLRVKRNLGSSHVWVSAYCNDVMAYIPSLRVLKEGGYEGGGAMVYYGLPTVWGTKVEEIIVGAAHEQVKKVRGR